MATRNDDGALEVVRITAQLGSGWSEARDGGGSELDQGAVALGEVFGHGQHVAVSVRVEGDDAPLLEAAQDASTSDLKGVSHVRGREARQRAALGAPSGPSGPGTYTPSKSSARRWGLSFDNRAALRELTRARAQVALVPAEDGVHEQARDGAEQWGVSQSRAEWCGSVKTHCRSGTGGSQTALNLTEHVRLMPRAGSQIFRPFA